MKSKILLFLSVVLVWVICASAQNSPKRIKSNVEPVKVGETAPDFTLSDENGKRTSLSMVKGPVVLVFYRGYW